MSRLTNPSGRIFDDLEQRAIRLMATYGMLVWTDIPFTLKSGIQSHVYFNGRDDLTDNPIVSEVFGQLLGRTFLRIMGTDSRKPIIIGVPTAANGFAASVTQCKQENAGGHRVGYRVMREKLKAHGSGTHQGFWVNGRVNTDNQWYASVENVVTSGASLEDAIGHMKQDGYPVADMPHFVVMDRLQGGVAKLRAKGYTIHTMFELLDVVNALCVMQIPGWGDARQYAVEEEIKAHQVLS